MAEKKAFGQGLGPSAKLAHSQTASPSSLSRDIRSWVREEFRDGTSPKWVMLLDLFLFAWKFLGKMKSTSYLCLKTLLIANQYKNLSWDHHLLLLPDLPALSPTIEKTSLPAPTPRPVSSFPWLLSLVEAWEPTLMSLICWRGHSHFSAGPAESTMSQFWSASNFSHV